MKVIQTTRLPDGMDIKTDAGLLRIQADGERILHVRFTQKKDFSPAKNLMIVRAAPRAAALSIFEDLEIISLKTASLSLEINKSTGSFTWSDQQGNLLVREPERGGKSLQEIEIRGRKGYSTKLELSFSNGEAVYGLGQHEEGVYNQRGHSQMLYQHNLKVAMPVLVSTRGYAILFDSYSLATFHDDQYGTYFWTEFDDEMEFYFLYGPELDDLIGEIRWLTGPVPLLPRWALGYIQSKERYKRQSELIEIVQEYRRRSIGLDGIVQDWQYWKNGQWGQKSLDPDRYPDPDKMMQDLHQLNAHLMVSTWPRFSSSGENQSEMSAGGFLLSDGATYNAFDPAARALYWKQANDGLFQHGIDAWWCDCSEPFEPDWHGAMRPEPWQRMVNNTAEFKNHLEPELINAYSLVHSQGIYEGQRSVSDEKRVLNLTRSSYPGQARYGTVTWSGDICADWETLRRQIPAGLNFTVTGSPRWTFDIGGFFVDRHPDRWFWNGAFPNGCEDRGYRELYLRWFQIGTFLPMLRAHGTDTPREVWRFGKPGETVYDTLVKFIRLRYRLIPYLYSLAAWESFRSYTMLRSLVFDFRHDPLVYDIADQFMLGPALMVCPITEPMFYGPGSQPIEDKPAERDVYLPSGCSWYNFWTGKRYAGGQKLRTAAPLEIVPLFVRAGSILPMGPERQFADEKPGAPLELRLYPGSDCHFDLYDDEGDSYRYEQGLCTWQSINWQEKEHMLTVEPRQGFYEGMPQKQAFRITLAGAGIEPGEAAGEGVIKGQETFQWHG
jgi:alpha-D-xyloside xylohydrolase